MSNLADDFDLAEILLNPGGILIFYVIQVHDLILDEEIQFPAQEFTQIFVNEIVLAVAAGVIFQVLGKQGAIIVALGRGECG